MQSTLSLGPDMQQNLADAKAGDELSLIVKVRVDAPGSYTVTEPPTTEEAEPTEPDDAGVAAPVKTMMAKGGQMAGGGM